MQFFSKPNINFVGKRSLFATISIIVISVGMIAAIALGPRLGIDFAGGTEVAIHFLNKNVGTEDLRQAMESHGVDGAEIKSYGAENQYLIRLKEFENADMTVQNAISAAYPDAEIDILKVDKIGPKIGNELYADALLAIFLAVVFMLVYIAFRFEFNFGIGAVIALIHDVLLTFAIIVLVDHTGLVNLELNIITVAALLTVVGYSINDTVIVFDRIRENKDVHKGMNFVKMVNLSVNETLSRTVNTSVTTLIVLLVLLFLGGPVLEGFAFTMIIGIITGTYSSIFIASSFVIWYLVKVKKMDFSEKDVKTKPAKA